MLVTTEYLYVNTLNAATVLYWKRDCINLEIPIITMFSWQKNVIIKRRWTVISVSLQLWYSFIIRAYTTIYQKLWMIVCNSHHVIWSYKVAALIQFTILLWSISTWKNHNLNTQKKGFMWFWRGTVCVCQLNLHKLCLWWENK